MLVHDFTVPQMVELVRAGLASAATERMVAGKHKIEVAVVRITKAGGGRFDCEETLMDDINRQDALRVHDRSRSYSEAEVAIRTVMLINGGAAVSALALMGALVRQDGGLTIKQIAGVSSSLLWFGGGVAAAAWALALSYFTNFCYVRSETSKIFTFDHPYIIDGAKTRWWACWGSAFHVGAIVWAMLSLAAFVIGMIDVRNVIVRLAG